MQAQLIEQLKSLRLRGMASALEESLTALSQTFSVAFTRYVGLPPTRYAREQMESRRPKVRGVKLSQQLAKRRPLQLARRSTTEHN